MEFKTGDKVINKNSVIVLVTNDQPDYEWFFRGVVLNKQFLGTIVLYKKEDFLLYTDKIEL